MQQIFIFNCTGLCLLQLRQEILDVFWEIQNMIQGLKGKLGLQTGPESAKDTKLKPGSLLSAVQELKSLTEDAINSQRLQSQVRDHGPSSL